MIILELKSYFYTTLRPFQDYLDFFYILLSTINVLMYSLNIIRWEKSFWHLTQNIAPYVSKQNNQTASHFFLYIESIHQYLFPVCFFSFSVRSLQSCHGDVSARPGREVPINELRGFTRPLRVRRHEAPRLHGHGSYRSARRSSPSHKRRVSADRRLLASLPPLSRRRMRYSVTTLLRSRGAVISTLRRVPSRPPWRS